MTKNKVNLDFFNGEGWQEYPDIPHEDWQYAVENDDTQMGYAYFVASSLEADEVEFEFSDPRIEQEVYAPIPELSDQASERFTQEWWKEEVAELNTRLGYKQWALSQQQELDNVVAEDISTSRPRPMKP